MLTPFFLGAAFGAIASGRVRAGDPGGDPLVGLDQPDAAADRRARGAVRGVPGGGVPGVRRAPRAGTRRSSATSAGARSAAPSSTGLLAIAGLFVLRSDAPFCFDGLMHAGAPVRLLLGGLRHRCLTLLASGITRATRALAVGAVVAVLAGWGVAQYPYLLPTSLTIEAGGGRARDAGLGRWSCS